MAIGTSIALIAIGAILKFAVNFSITGIDINVVGLILMIVGVLGLAVSLVMMINDCRARHADLGGSIGRAPSHDVGGLLEQATDVTLDQMMEIVFPSN